MKEAVAELEASDLDPGRDSDFVAKLLDESDALEFRTAERILDALERQGRTIAGYPRVRPADCAHFLSAMRLVFESCRRSFITADPRIVRRFEEILEAFEKTDVRSYPRELMRARTLQAEARLLLNNPTGARALMLWTLLDRRRISLAHRALVAGAGRPPISRLDDPTGNRRARGG